MINTFLHSYGINREVGAPSVARLADAMGNHLLVDSIPLYVSKLSSPSIPKAKLVGLLVSVYGLVFTLLLPSTGAMSVGLDQRAGISMFRYSFNRRAGVRFSR